MCIDLSSTSRKLVRKWFPSAKIVADRFHVVRLLAIAAYHWPVCSRQRLSISEVPIAALRRASNLWYSPVHCYHAQKNRAIKPGFKNGGRRGT
ncbi:MAG TPA: hypothetical protein DD423_07635 [Opitutae bacterium]|nr:hypothetical protein [Opitutae bacterium]